RSPVRAAVLESARDHAELLDRPGREYPDAHQHDAVLRGADRRRQRRLAVHRPASRGQAPRPGSHARAAGRPAARAHRGRRAGHGLGEPPRRPRGGGEDRYGAEPAREGPRLVHRLRAGREAGAGRGRDHGVCGTRHDGGALCHPDAPPIHPRPGHRGRHQGEGAARRGRGRPGHGAPPGGAGPGLRRRPGAGRQRAPGRRAPVRTATLDRRLLWVSLGLMLFGLLTLYSAGQTDVPTRAAGVWYRQFFWFGIGVVVGWGVFHVSLRLLEWLAPALYGFSLVLLGIVLVVGTGAGTAQSSHSWLSVGGHQIGQPSELAKVATVLMLARYLSGRKEPPRSFRDLLMPAIIVGVPFLLVLKQPDL